MTNVAVRIRNIVWRGGRPRFEPGPSLRAVGFTGEDLKRPDGSWFTPEQAGAWAAVRNADCDRRLEQRRAGERLPRLRHARAVTVADLFATWFKSARFQGKAIEDGRRRRKPLAAATVGDYVRKAAALQAFDATLAQTPAAQVNAVAAQCIFDKLETGKGLHMARGIAAVASSCWSWARRRGVGGVTVNPWRDLDRPEPAPRLVVWEDAEVVAFAKAADDLGRPEIADALYLGLFTGQRQADRLALTDAGRDDGGRRLFKQSKTGAIVAVRETPQLAARLAAARARRKVVRLDGAFVIVDERTGAPMTGGAYRKLFAAVRQRAADVLAVSAGREAAKAMLLKRDQDLRDTAVTWLARAGCTAPEIASITGHSLVTVHAVLRRYLVLHPEMSDAAIWKLVAWIGERGMVV